MLKRRARCSAIAMVCGLLVAGPLTALPARADTALPTPFKVSYDVSYRGIGAGQLVFELTPAAERGFFNYVSTAKPSFLASIVVSRSARESSELAIDADGVRPLVYRLEDGRSGTAHDASLDFDWEKRIATGRAKDKPVELELEPGLQDRMSIQIEVIADLLAGREPGTIGMIDDGRVKEYVYTREGEEHLKTALGEFETVVYASTRPQSDRVARFWYAPDLGYVPVRAEQVRKGRVETVMEIAAFSRPGS